MTERKAKAAEISPEERGDAAERALGRAVAVGLPIATVIAAIAVGWIASMGSALLVVASGALLGTIGLLWASVRTLSGDAPLPQDLEEMAARRHDVDALAEQKRRVLRALKDLEGEHALGKIDDADYEDIAMQYRREAKDVMRAMDESVAPALAEAEKLAREYLGRQGLGAGPGAKKSAQAEDKAEAKTAPTRVPCGACGTANDDDAAFCKKCGAALNKGEAKAQAPRDASEHETESDATR